ncbi:MAG: hypothetical protein ACJ0OL_02065 [Dehalococcoidia bacterium]
MGNQYEKEIEEIIDRSNNSSFTKRKPPFSYYWREIKRKYSPLLSGIIILFLILISSTVLGVEIALASTVILLLLFYAINKYQKYQNKHRYKKKWRGKEVD